MIINKELPDYNAKTGFKSVWEPNFTISVEIVNNSVILSANNDGLKSLAWQLLTLSQNEFPPDYHLHYDESNSLEDNSTELIIKKI